MGGMSGFRTASKQLARFVMSVLLISALFAAAGCTSEGSSAGGGDEPIRVGAVLSLSGTYAALGQSERNAIELEVERINKADGIDGRKIEVLVEDDATDESKAVAAVSRLIEQEGVVAVIGATGTGQSMAMRGDVQRAGIPQISMAGGMVITKEFDEHVFQTPWSNTIVVPFVLEAIEQAGHTKIALVSDTGGYGKDGRAVITEAAAKAGLEIVADETFNPGDSDMTAQLTKVKGSGADAVLLWTAGKEAVIVMKNAEALGLTEGDGALPFFGGSGQARREFVEGAGAAAEGFVFGTGKSLVPSTWGEGTEQEQAMVDFAERYEKAYGEQPDIFAGHAYDAVNLLADALRRAGVDADGRALLEALESTDGLVGYGGTFTFSKTDHNGLTEEDLALFRIEDGTWVPAR